MSSTKRMWLTIIFIAATVQQPLYAATNILLQGAKGDCVSNDAPVINATIQAIANAGTTHSGEIYFPAPTGGCYLVNQPIVLPGPRSGNYNIVISLVGEGRGVSVIKAGAEIDAVLEKDQYWSQGDTVTDLTFDANGKAKHAILLLGGDELRITRVEGLNGTIDDLRLDPPANYASVEEFITDSYFANTLTFPAYNIYVGTGSTDNEFSNDVEINAKIANIDEINSSSNHFVGNHAYGWPIKFCPLYSFMTGFTSIWVGNQSDCSTQAAFFVNNWQSMIEANFIQGAANHAVCISPKVGDNQVLGNTELFNNANQGADDAVVQGVIEDGSLSCSGSGVHTPIWANSQNFNNPNIVQNNWPTSNESLWSGVFPSMIDQKPAIGVGIPAPKATLDINGFARLSTNTTAPAACTASDKGAMALNSSSHLCICNGSAWILDSTGQSCKW